MQGTPYSIPPYRTANAIALCLPSLAFKLIRSSSEVFQKFLKKIIVLTMLNQFIIFFYKSVSLAYNRGCPSYCTFLKTPLYTPATVTGCHSTVGAAISSTTHIHINIRISSNNRNPVLLTFPQDKFTEKEGN